MKKVMPIIRWVLGGLLVIGLILAILNVVAVIPNEYRNVILYIDAILLLINILVNMMLDKGGKH